MRVIGLMRYLIGVLTLEELVRQKSIEVVGVIASSKDPYYGLPISESVKLAANRHCLPVYQVRMDHVNRPKMLEAIRRLKPDLIVSAYPSTLFSKELLEIPRVGIINFHPSRLPEGRGFATSIYHMYKGDDKNWITLHWVDSGIDTGDIISQASVAISAEDTGFTARHKLFQKAPELLSEALPQILEGKAPRKAQGQIADVKEGTFNWQDSYAEIEWERSAEEVAHRVRTLTHPRDFAFDTPSAYTHLARRRVLIWDARPVARGRRKASGAAPGEITAITGEGLLVHTGEGEVMIRDAEMEGAEREGLLGLIECLSGVPAIFG